MTTLETLQAARSLIAKGWIKGDAACTIDGTPVVPWDDNAVAFCTAGALVAVDRTSGFSGVYGTYVRPYARQALTEALNGKLELTDFNDDPETTKKDVLALYDRAIARL